MIFVQFSTAISSAHKTTACRRNGKHLGSSAKSRRAGVCSPPSRKSRELHHDDRGHTDGGNANPDQGIGGDGIL